MGGGSEPGAGHQYRPDVLHCLDSQSSPSPGWACRSRRNARIGKFAAPPPGCPPKTNTHSERGMPKRGVPPVIKAKELVRRDAKAKSTPVGQAVPASLPCGQVVQCVQTGAGRAFCSPAPFPCRPSIPLPIAGLRTTRPGLDRLCSPMLASRAPNFDQKSPCVRDRPLVGQGTDDGAKPTRFRHLLFPFEARGRVLSRTAASGVRHCLWTAPCCAMHPLVFPAGTKRD
jgi:hypothetical protein